MPVIFVGISWFIGIWLAAQASLEQPVWLGIGLAGWSMAVWLGRRNGQVGLVLACIGMIGWGGWRYQSAVPVIDMTHIAFYNGAGQLDLTGIVVAEPDIRDRYVNLRVAVNGVVLPDGTEQPVTGEILLRTFRFPVIAYGSELHVAGQLETPPEFSGFSYKDYLARQGIHSMMDRGRVQVLAEQQGHPVYQAILTVKGRAKATITHLIPDPEAALLTGILLGDDNGLSPALAEDFRLTGLTHIIAISGFNIAILIAILVRLADPFLSRRGAVIFAVGGVTLYTVLVGADASVVRAALMGTLYLVGNRLLGRPSFAYASLLVSGILMTAVNPFTLWDVGFQLSFAATLGLMLYADPLIQATQSRLARHFDRKIVKLLMGFLSEAVLITLAAQVLTLPLMLVYFEQLSLISFPANMLVLPAQGGVMLWGGITTLVGMIVPGVGQLFGWVAWLFLTYTIFMVRLLAQIPGAAVPLSLSGNGLLLLYGIIAGLTWWAKQTSDVRQVWQTRLCQQWSGRIGLGAGALATLLVFSWAATQPDGRLHVSFLDVGQGDAIFIQTPTGRQILVDGGYYPTILNDALGRQMPFWDRHLDMIVTTHADADHVSGLPGIFDRYRVDKLLTNGDGLGESAVYDAVLLAAATRETAVIPISAGEIIELGDGVRLEMVHPAPDYESDNRNDRSVSFQLRYGSFSLLLTGDAEEEAEAHMLQTGRVLPSLVFKAGHHGSKTSSTIDFLEAVQPQIIIVSAGLDNTFGHPHAEMIERARTIGAAILRTDELGTIAVTTDGQQMWWQAQH